MCQARQNDGWIPINKNLWYVWQFAEYSVGILDNIMLLNLCFYFIRSFSFILALTSTAFILLAVLYILIDLTKIWNGAPFRYVGKCPCDKCSYFTQYLMYIFPRFELNINFHGKCCLQVLFPLQMER